MNARTLIQVDEVSKVYGRGRSAAAAVDGVSFRLTEKSTLAIVGESGSGKSTLARMVMGMTVPTAGTIELDGGEVPASAARAADRRRRARFVQMVFQDPYSSLDPRQRIEESLDEAIALHEGLSPTARRARVDELLDQVALDRALGRSFPRALSGGQRQRVAIARALAARPRVVVLDEAVSALDVSVQARVLDLLEGIREDEGVSMLFISHDLGVVRRISDDVIVMRAGRVVEAGDTASVLENPQHPYTRLLADCVPGPGWKAADALAAIDVFRRSA